MECVKNQPERYPLWMIDNGRLYKRDTARISQRYYWPKLRADVAAYIRKYNICLQTKPEQKGLTGYMLSVQPTAERP